MEADKKPSKLSQVDKIAPWVDRSPFFMMSRNSIPLAPSSYQVLPMMKRFETGGSSSTTTTTGANSTPPQPSDSNTTVPTATTPAIEPMSKDKGKRPRLAGSDGYGGQGNDHNSVNVHTQKGANANTPNGAPIQLRGNVAPESMDPKKLKRILSNRVSAQKARLKKEKYVFEMEANAKALEAKIAVLKPRIEYVRNCNFFLGMERRNLQEKISDMEVSNIHREARIEANRKEVHRIRQLQLQQMDQMIAMQVQACMLMNSGQFVGHGLVEDQKIINPGYYQSEQLINIAESSHSAKAQTGEKAIEENMQHQSSVSRHTPAGAKATSSEAGGRMEPPKLLYHVNVKQEPLHN